MERVILHSDANSFYASVECLYHPELRNQPVAVCGDPDQRHGIVLTANPLAKRTGLKVGMAVWQARQCCPGLVVVRPHYELYLHFSELLHRIYSDYSDRVEAFGLDECWVCVSDPHRTIADGERLANELRARVREELGITVSVGVSFNKIFAKLASDMKKPDATTVIPQACFRDIVWPLPVSDLLFVGRSTTRKLMDVNICTIGDLANCSTDWLSYKLGKVGLLLQAYALGQDMSPVRPSGVEAAIKSVGNSTTPPHDIRDLDDAKCLFYLLAESVAARLREGGFRARCVCVSVRSTELFWFSRQMQLSKPTCFTDDIAQAALTLFVQNCRDRYPFRSVGIQCTKLEPLTAPLQLDLLEDPAAMAKREALTKALDDLWRRYGNKAIRRGVILTDSAYAADDPQTDHTIHPVPFYSG